MPQVEDVERAIAHRDDGRGEDATVRVPRADRGEFRPGLAAVRGLLEHSVELASKEVAATRRRADDLLFAPPRAVVPRYVEDSVRTDGDEWAVAEVGSLRGRDRQCGDAIERRAVIV